jgi:N-acetylglucosaminyl-diphospho-decaprenol L-rhamnosyltransferase
MAHDLSIVIVSWNVKDLLRACLRSTMESLEVRAPAELDCEIVVVDNFSVDGSAGLVMQEFPSVRLLANSENVGFTRGNNQGIAATDGRYVLLLNPDTEVLGSALGALVCYMERHPEVAAVGPKLLYADGGVQSSRRRFPNLATALVEGTFAQAWFRNSGLLRHYYALDRGDDETQEVDWLVGACLMMRRAAISNVGLLDERFFMYSEELDWCYRARTAGWKIVYLPTASVIHHEGKSSEQVLPLRHLQFQRSKVLFFVKHHGRLQGGILRIYLLSSYLWQTMVEGFKYLLGHKRPLRRRRVLAYWQVLRSGLR